MRKLVLVAFAAALFAAPRAASAGLGVAASLGSGYGWDPAGRQPTSLMIAPGFSVPFVRAELGMVGALGDVRGGEFDLEFRPMLVVSPPLFPLYARAIFAVTNVLTDLTYAYGGALGFTLGLGGIAAFAEVGVLPRHVEVATATGTESEFKWLAEARIGVSYGF